MVEEGAEYQIWDLCELLCEKSRAVAEGGGDSALELAELALHVAERVSGTRLGARAYRPSPGLIWDTPGGSAATGRGPRKPLPGSVSSGRDGGARALLLDEARIADLENLVSGLSGPPP